METILFGYYIGFVYRSSGVTDSLRLGNFALRKELARVISPLTLLCGNEKGNITTGSVS